jgi:uncharacterized membrane protein
MEFVTIILEGLRVIFGFLLLLFIPGFALTLVYFPRLSEIGIIERLVYSMVLSIGSVIVIVLFMDVFLGVNTNPINIFIVIAGFSYLAMFVWLCEIYYIKSNLKIRIDQLLSRDYRSLRKYIQSIIDSVRTRVIRNK